MWQSTQCCRMSLSVFLLYRFVVLYIAILRTIYQAILLTLCVALPRFVVDGHGIRSGRRPLVRKGGRKRRFIDRNMNMQQSQPVNKMLVERPTQRVCDVTSRSRCHGVTLLEQVAHSIELLTCHLNPLCFGANCVKAFCSKHGQSLLPIFQ